MESGGVLAAVHKQSPQTQAIVIRGISDLADERKAKLDRIRSGSLRRYAMRNALELLGLLLRTGALPRAKQ